MGKSRLYQRKACNKMRRVMLHKEMAKKIVFGGII